MTKKYQKRTLSKLKKKGKLHNTSHFGALT